MGARDIIVGLIVLGVFFWTPTLSAHILRKHKLKILGAELVPIVLPIIASVGIYKQDWQTAMFGISASVGYFLGLWHARTQKAKAASFSYYTLTPESARDVASDLLVKAMNDCKPESGAYLAAKTEIDRRVEVNKNWRKVGITVVVGLISLALWSLRG